jgi:DNA helicase-2/ATP-dependent DNA helicase PcrA
MDIAGELNPQQQQAVTSSGRAILVLAGPGSGKTRVLAHRIAHLVQQRSVAPWAIMAVTFTNKAAREMRERVERLLGGQPDGLTLGTFHATCARILRRQADCLTAPADFVIYDAKDQESVVKQALKKLNLDEKRYRPRQILSIISRAKNELIAPEAFQARTYLEEVAGRVYGEYQALLRENDALDFDDLLMQVVFLLDTHPAVLRKYQQRYRHILVDEFQDTNTAQYVLIKQLAGGQGNLFCVGDEDQSIYLFRGADWRNVRRFREDYPESETILLEQNYRSTQLILDAAQAVIKRNSNRTHKALFTERKGGARITVGEPYDEDEEAEFVVNTIRRGNADPGSYAIMYRTNAQSRRIEEAFVRAGMPYRLVGATRFYARREVKDVIAYLRVVHNQADSIGLLRIINVPPRGIGAKTIAALQNWAAEQGIPLAAALEKIAATGAGTRSGRAPLPFPGRARKALVRFANLLTGWVMQRDTVPVPELMDLILEKSGYRAYLCDGSREGEDRWENILELRNVAREYPELTLTEFLERVALVSEVDNLTDEGDAPTLLTLHAAKGLEFPTVFILGVEEGILPHKRSWDEPEQMAEERRLFYVGITRARNKLYLLHCFRRAFWGDPDLGLPSRFLSDLPPELIDDREGMAAGAAVSYDYTGSALFSPRSSGTVGRSLLTPARAPSRGIPPSPVKSRPIARPVEPSYRTGQRVRHDSFGEGIVIEAEPADGDEIVTVAFEDKGLKRLLASMAKLQAVDDE